MGKGLFHFHHMILLLTLVASHSLASTHPRCREDERSALLEFKTTFFTRKPQCCGIFDNGAPFEQATKIEAWNASTRGTPSDCCSWAGVECDMVSGHVIGLDLSCSCLSGKINSNTSIFRLLRLRSLNLAFNDFECQIPPAIGNLGSLSHLNFSLSFMGPIPHSLGNLTRLTHLELSSNSLNGTIPSSLGNLVQLKYLSLRNNELIGQIPSSFGNLVQLTDLDLSDNQLIGQIPSSLGNLIQLIALDLSYNQLIGQIPSSLGNLVQLTDLDLSYNQLIGQIPSSLGNLVQLIHLYLSDNQLTGEIPSSIGNLIQLTYLYLNYNKLVGEIPFSFQNLLELNILDLSQNRLSGEIQSWLGRLTNLTFVRLSFNHFHGAIPSTIFQLQGLRYLDLASNNLSGTVKLDTFSKAENLTGLILSSNKLSLIVKENITRQYDALGLGSCNLNGFPEFLQHQDDLYFLDLSYNNISGQVPKWFLNVSTENLRQLNISGNFLTSFAQDPVIFKWKLLYVADLGFNKLRGSVPIPPPQISHYFISNNMLSGGISPLICNLSYLTSIDLSANHLTGFLPPCLSNLSGALEVMSLQSNNFIGKIPDLNGNFCALKMIDLSYNEFQGPLPSSFHHCNGLEFLNFGNNQIRDVFPSWLGSLPSLKVFILRYNRFHGVIGEPGDRTEFPALQIIDLSQNRFSGNLPFKYFKHWTATKVPETDSSSYIGNAVGSISIYSPAETFDYSMRVIAKGIQIYYSKIQVYLMLVDLSSNNFSGGIPETIGSLKQLNLLNLSNNILAGPLPPFLANLTHLEALDLSQNRLSGEIPLELTRLTSLAVFNVSYNHLTGPIPQSWQFATFQKESYKGNWGLCGKPLSRKCRDPKPSSPTSPTSGEDRDFERAMKLDWKIVCMGYASGLVIGLVLGSCLITRKRAQSLVKNCGGRKQRRRR